MSLTSLLEDRVVLVVDGTARLGAGVPRASAREGAHVAVAGRRLERAEALATELRALGSESLAIRCDVADAGCRRLHDRALRADRRACQLRRPDDPGHAARHHARALRRTHRDQPARSVLHDAVGGRRHGEAWRPRQHRQHHLDHGARRAAVPRSVRGGQGRAGGVDPQRRPRPPLGPHPDQRPRHRLDRDRGRRHTIQRRFHGAGDDWVTNAAASLPMGKLGQVDEIADMVVFLLSDRSGVVTGSVIDWDQNIQGCHD